MQERQVTKMNNITLNPGLHSRLLLIISTNAQTRQNGKVASERTYSVRKESLLSCFKDLIQLGYRLQDPANLSEKHVARLMEYWLFEKKLMPKTIEGHLSSLRIFAQWIGKPGIVKGKLDYLPKDQHYLLKVETAARTGKSPASKDIDVNAIIARADAENRRFGLMLRLELAFGLRRNEVLKCRPHTQDFEQYLLIEKGHGKGGKERTIKTLTTAQREIIQLIKKEIPPAEAMGWPLMRDGKTHANLEQNINRYNKLMAKIGMTKNNLGVTGHSLRAQFAENNALVHGVTPPSLGGTQGQMSKSQLRPILMKLSQAMGHNRINVMSSYYCSFGHRVALEAERTLQKIEASLPLIPQDQLIEVPEERWDDCIFMRNKLNEVGLDMSLKQMHYLWQMYSQRNGVEWVKPEHEIAICLQSSSLSLLKSVKS